jgi:hypothetical protein
MGRDIRCKNLKLGRNINVWGRSHSYGGSNMSIKIRLVIATAAITGVIATIVHATPIVGLLVGAILSTARTTTK